MCTCVSYTRILALDWQLVDVAVGSMALDGAGDATLTAVFNGYGERDGHARNQPMHHRLAGFTLHIYRGERTKVKSH